MTLPNELQNNTTADADEVQANFDYLEAFKAGAESAWTSWTPTWTNLTIGNATVVAKYKQIGKTILLRVKVTFGSTTSMGGGNPKFSLPEAFNSEYDNVNHWVGNCNLIDTGVTAYQGAVLLADTQNMLLRLFSTGGTYLQNVTINSITPFTWGTGDLINVQAFYETS